MEHKSIKLQEFLDKGYLQEVNRLFFHPLGLSFEVVVNEDDKVVKFWDIWDYRDNPEGAIFNNLSKEKAFNVEEQKQKLAETRLKLLGYSIQPIVNIK